MSVAGPGRDPALFYVGTAAGGAGAAGTPVAGVGSAASAAVTPAIASLTSAFPTAAAA